MAGLPADRSAGRLGPDLSAVVVSAAVLSDACLFDAGLADAGLLDAGLGDAGLLDAGRPAALSGFSRFPGLSGEVTGAAATDSSGRGLVASVVTDTSLGNGSISV